MCFTVVFLEIIPKTIWNCIIACFNPLIRKHVTHAMYTNAMDTCLEYKKKTNPLSSVGWMVKDMSEWLMLDLLKNCCNCFLLSLDNKYLNEHTIYYNFSFLIEKSFWNLSSLLHNLTYLSLSDSFLFLSTFSVFLKGSITTFSEGLLKSFFLANF